MDEGAANGKATASFTGADERIYGLLAVVEDQQMAVRAGIQGLTIERAQLATQIKRLSDKLVSAVSSSIPQVAESAGEAARKAFRAMLAGSGQAVLESVARSAQPGLDKFKEAMALAEATKLELEKVFKDFKRKWAWVVAFAMAGLVLAAARNGLVADPRARSARGAGRQADGRGERAAGTSRASKAE